VSPTQKIIPELVGDNSKAVSDEKLPPTTVDVVTNVEAATQTPASVQESASTGEIGALNFEHLKPSMLAISSSCTSRISVSAINKRCNYWFD
jgi:hypothetical protein